MTVTALLNQLHALSKQSRSTTSIRSLLVELALRGKLVEDSPEDGSVDDLLEAVRRQRLEMVASGEIKARPMPPQSVEEPFELPLGWRWASISDFGHELGQRVPNEPFTYLDVGSIDAKEGRIEGNPVVLRPEHAPSRARKLVLKDSVIYSTVRPYLLNVAILDREFVPEPVASTAFAVVHPFDGMNPEFLFRWLRSQAFNSYVEGWMRGQAYPAISERSFYNGPVPVPPSEVQNRIVSKLTQLFAVCDLVDSYENDAGDVGARLAEAVVADFIETPSHSNLDSLFSPACPITPTQLRDCILTLAVKGKLLDQKPTDESASEALRRIGVVDGMGNSIDDDTISELPSSWRTVAFGAIAEVKGGVTLGRRYEGTPVVRLPYLRVANVKRGEIDLADTKELAIPELDVDKYALREHDLLMTEGGDRDKVGRAAVWHGQLPVCIHQNHIFRARMRSEELSSEWFALYFNSPPGRRYFQSAAKQTTNLASINMSQVRACPVPFPSPEEQERIVAHVSAILGGITSLEHDGTERERLSEQALAALVFELLRMPPNALARSNR